MLSSPLGLMPTGCITLLTDPEIDGLCHDVGGCNGVKVYCINHGGGQDGTAGGGEPVQNFWWNEAKPGEVGVLSEFDHCDGLTPEYEGQYCCETIGFGDVKCWVATANQGGKIQDIQTGFWEYAPHGGSLDYPPSLDHICVGSNWPALPGSFDPLWNWEPVGDGEGGSGGPPIPGTFSTIEPEIRDACSTRCEILNRGSGQEICEPENWSAVLTEANWYPRPWDAPTEAASLNCQVTMMSNADDPLGLAVPWEEAGGDPDPLPLGCSLTDDCGEWFYPSVLPFTHWTSIAGAIEPETRNAAYLGVEDGGVSRISLHLDMPGMGRSGIDDDAPLWGLAEYSPVDCGDDVCPFYLANLSAYNTTSTWDVQLMLDDLSHAKKRISNVQIDLIQSTLGIHNLALNKVAFAPGALRLGVELTISNQPGETNSYGNGTHSAIVENVDYVFADYWNGALSLSHAFPVQGGVGTLTLQLAPDERPPVASHDLPSTQACNKPWGVTLYDHVTSTDPDDDIVEDVWWVDGLACSGTCGMSFGSHLVMLEARDARGAADRTDPQWVYVAPGC